MRIRRHQRLTADRRLLLLLPALLLAAVLPAAGCRPLATPPPGPDGGSPTTSDSRPAADEPPPGPNIVMVFVDDLRYDTMGCTGHPVVETPNLDRLAAEGALFTNAFVITSLCCPSRATVLSGLYTHMNGVSFNGEDLEYGTHPFLPEFLKSRGYATAFIGKYHMGGERMRPRPGFDHWISLKGVGEYFDASMNIDGVRRDVPGYSTDFLTDRAVEWIQQQAGEPFFLILSLKNPHIPYTPPERHKRLYKGVTIELPDSFHDLPENLPRFMGEKIVEMGEEGDSTRVPHSRYALTSNEEKERTARQRIRSYWRMVPSIDESMGRLLASLEEEGVLEQTAIVFFSDNGFLLGEHGVIGKGLPFEPSIKVPMLVRYPPLIPAGTRVDEQVLNLDLAPTVLDLAGVERPEEMHGRSIASLFTAGGEPWRRDWLYVSSYPQRSTPNFLGVRGDRFKYIRYRGKKRGFEELLYDIREDPGERHDLAADPSHAGQLEQMRLRLRELMAQENVPMEWWEPK